MKNLIQLCVSLAALAFSFVTFAQQGQVYSIDSSQGQVKWTGTKVTGKHWGTVQVKGGQVRMDGANLLGGTVMIDMTSIKVDDIKDAKTNAKLVGHLKNDDFFAVDKHPTATLEMSEVKARSGEKGTFDVNGQLTIRGVSKPVSFQTKMNPSAEGMVSANARVVWNRAHYDIKYKSGSFFEKLGDQLIHDDVTMEVTLVAKSTQQTKPN